MALRLSRWLMTAMFVGLAATASAQETGLLTYDIQMQSALQMQGSTFVLPPGEYRLEQFDKTAPELFILREKDLAGQFGPPLAVLEASRVPYAEGLGHSGVRLETDPDARGVAVLTGWQLGSAYWRLDHVASLDGDYFTAR